MPGAHTTQVDGFLMKMTLSLQKRKKFIPTYTKNKFEIKCEEFESNKLKSPKFETGALRSITLGPAHNKAKALLFFKNY